jgi:hypothetical protein
MDMSVALSLREVFSISSDVSIWVSERSKKRRKPLEPVPTSSVNTVIGKPLYACPSGHAKVLVDDTLILSALLDGGSEVNLMPRLVFNLLSAPIDMDIMWAINSYNTETQRKRKDV